MVKVKNKNASIPLEKLILLTGLSWGNLIFPRIYNVNPHPTSIHEIKNASIFNIPQCSTKSAFDKNLKARAISTNPIITLIEFSHPPDWGNLLNKFGNIANIANGNPNESPKPNIAIVIGHGPSVKEPAKTEPKIGPVQENETIAKVSAIKNIPNIPCWLDAESDLLAHLLGSFNS